MATVLSQECTVYTDTTGAQKFKIISTIESFDSGDLPSASIFVHQIVATNDPKADVFLRVANVVDLTTLKRSRQLAVNAGESIYADVTFTVIYDDVATAAQAKLLIQQRVDNCIADWHTYNDQFVNPLDYPTVTPTATGTTFPMTTTLEDQLKAEYATAHAAYLSSQTAVVSATAAVTASVTAATAANENLAGALTDSQECSNILGQFNTAKRSVDSYRVDMNTFVPQAQTYSDASTTFKAAVDAYKTAYDTFKTACDTYSTASDTFETASNTFKTAATTYAGYGTTPSAGQLATFNTAIGVFNTAISTFSSAKATYSSAIASFVSARSTYETAVAAWDLARLTFAGNVTSAASAVSAEANQSEPLMNSLSTTLATACTKKLAYVQVATSDKTAADKALGTAATEKKAADAAAAAALAEDTRTYLAVKEICPEYPRITP